MRKPSKAFLDSIQKTVHTVTRNDGKVRLGGKCIGLPIGTIDEEIEALKEQHKNSGCIRVVHYTETDTPFRGLTYAYGMTEEISEGETLLGG